MPDLGSDRRRLGTELSAALAVAGREPVTARTCWQLFTQGDPVRYADVCAALGEDVTDLARRRGLLTPIDDAEFVRSTACIAQVELPNLTAWVASDFGWQDLEPAYVGGPGNAALTLAKAMVPSPGAGLGVDMGTGSGALAVMLAGGFDDVIVTDVNPRALAYAELTAALNELQWQCRLGSFTAALPLNPEPTYIVSNPPFVLGNPDHTNQFRDALDGARQPFRLVEELSQVLADGGVGQFLANWAYLAGEDDPVNSLLTHATDHDCDIVVIERAMVDLPTYVDLWTEERGGRHRAWVDRLAEAGVRAIGTGIVTVRRRRSGDPFFAVQRHTEESTATFGASLGRWLDRLRLTDSAAGLTEEVVLKAAPYVVEPDGQFTFVRVDDELGLRLLTDDHGLESEVLPILQQCHTPRAVADIAVSKLSRAEIIEAVEWYVEVGLLEPVASAR
ncbi:methyltransferase family protein [Antricoccus suffuscus]|uniref:Methyltransferase family protein n=2 Tax=Antricoccus suffuscus TaxID=1629062 RepID=A0A2T1A587_9ACTN|nr:methyltransferase family protein [Antricoccus suffuscus]